MDSKKNRRVDRSAIYGLHEWASVRPWPKANIQWL